MLPSHVKVFFEFRHADYTRAAVQLYYTETTGTITLANILNAADEIHAIFNAEVISSLISQCTFKTMVRKLTNTVDIEGAFTDAPSSGDIEDSETLPETDAVVMRRRTGKPGRNKRGRIFWPYIPESLQKDGQLTDDGVDIYKAIAYKLKVPLVLATTGVTLTPVTPDFKTNALEIVTDTQVVGSIMSRRDRMQPKRPLVISTPP